jgi:hypothetical protein
VDTYVVYIYRRPRKRGEQVVGLVQRVGSEERKSFRTAAQLLEYLLAQDLTRKDGSVRRKAEKKS